MKITHLLAAAAALAAVPLAAQAQHDIQLPLQYGPQQLWSNPALLQDHRVSVMLPSVGAGFNTPFTVDDAGTVDNGKLVVDPDQLINRLGDRGNDQRFGGLVETFGFNYRHRGWQCGVSHALRTAGTLDLPRGLVQLAVYGNGRYVGQELQVAPDLSAYAYQEFGAHGAYTFHDVLTVGGRVKVLVGTAALHTARASAVVYTDPDFYETTVTSDILLYTAGVPATFDQTGIDIGEPAGLSGAGTGFGLDLGAVYRSGEKLQLGFSVRDLGSINWKRDAMQHRSNGTHTFAGYEGNLFDEGGAFTFDPEATLDSVIAAVEFVSSEGGFATRLPTTLQATVRYALSRTTTFNGTVYAADQGTWQSGFGVGLGQQLGKFGHVSTLTGLRTGGAYLGGTFLVDLYGPQFYVACDNLLTVFDLNGAHDAFVRAGLNLTFGKVKQPKAVRGWYDTKVEGINM